MQGFETMFVTPAGRSATGREDAWVNSKSLMLSSLTHLTTLTYISLARPTMYHLLARLLEEFDIISTSAPADWVIAQEAHLTWQKPPFELRIRRAT
jgi:hypothetical protein